MPGAGSMVATNYLYGVAKPDGLTIGIFQTFMYLQQLVGVPEASQKRKTWCVSAKDEL
jgi:hypothetical protein